MNNRSQWGQYLRDAVYGGLDGTVTTFAIIAGATGANLSSTVIIVLGLANLFADGFSMAVGSYMGEHSKLQFFLKEKSDVQAEIEKNSQKLSKELKNIYQKKGMTEKNLTKFIGLITKSPIVWLDEILMHRGITYKKTNPFLSGLVTFLAFVIIGFVPIMPVIFWPTMSFFQILFLVAGVLFTVGSLRSKVTSVNWLRGGLEIMMAGVIASLIAFGVGEFLSQAVGLN
jgi:VIT1/CCC1 family predicted Fe2+/Mn2+ transporter